MIAKVRDVIPTIISCAAGGAVLTSTFFSADEKGILAGTIAAALFGLYASISRLQE